MPKLLIEIWECRKTGAFGCGVVNPYSDASRLREFEDPEKLHEYWASSILEAGQKYYDFVGYGYYNIGPYPNHFFTEEEMEDQQRYLAVRQQGSAHQD